ncbi:MAG: PadR family transcriptional regulator [Maricaulaceae bacterium]
MALAEAILVCLTEKPMSGYDLAKNFDASVGFFWRASHQQIYRELAKLRSRNLVQSEEISQSGKPNRIVHTITDEGRSVVHQWSLKQPRMPSVKDDLLLKFYGFDDIDLGAMVEHMSHRIEQHETRLQTYLKIKARHYDKQELTQLKTGKLIALEMGIENEKQQIKVFTDALVKARALI